MAAPRKTLAAHRLTSIAAETCRTTATVVVLAGIITWLAPGAEASTLTLLGFAGAALMVFALAEALHRLVE